MSQWSKMSFSRAESFWTSWCDLLLLFACTVNLAIFTWHKRSCCLVLRSWSFTAWSSAMEQTFASVWHAISVLLPVLIATPVKRRNLDQYWECDFTQHTGIQAINKTRQREGRLTIIFGCVRIAGFCVGSSRRIVIRRQHATTFCRWVFSLWARPWLGLC